MIREQIGSISKVLEFILMRKTYVALLVLLFWVSNFFFSLFDSSLLAAVAYFSFLQFCPKIASALFSFFVFSPVIQRQAERGEWFEFQFFLTMIALFCVFAMIYFLMYRPWRNKLCAAEKTNWLVIVQIGCFFIICAVLRIVMGMVSEGFC